jgi:hypothetical protein
MELVDLGSIRKAFDQYGTKGQCRLKLCSDLTFYFEESFRDNVDGIAHFYKKSMEHIGKDVKYFDIDGLNKFKKIQADTLELLPYWVKNKDEDREIYGLTLECGRTKADASDRAFDFYRGRVGMGHIRLVLPVEFINDSTDRFIELAQELCSQLHFLSGHAGYSTNIDLDFPSYEENGHVYALSRRYRGVDFGKPVMFADFMKHGIKTVNWLAFLGDELIAKVGGKSGLRSKLSHEIIIHDLPHGLMIQAGAEPKMGDVNRNENLQLYQEVGRALAALRIPDEVLRSYDGIGGTENTKNWLDRFFK